jgi:hypothetical protein
MLEYYAVECAGCDRFAPAVTDLKRWLDSQDPCRKVSGGETFLHTRVPRPRENNIPARMPENNNSAVVEHQNRSLLIQTIWKSCSIVEAYSSKLQSTKENLNPKRPCIIKQ